MTRPAARRLSEHTALARGCSGAARGDYSLRGGCRRAPRRRVADAHAMAGVLGGADDRIRADAEAGRTGVGLRAGIAVAARGPLRLRRWLTLSRCLVARAIVALIREGGAVTGGATAHASAAAVVHGAEETIIAGRTVGLARVGAAAGRRVAAARVVTLIEGGADDGVSADAGAGLAGVGRRAG